MIQGLAITTVWTFDQQRTKAFFTEKLGFEVRDDIAMGDMRWVTVGAKGQPDVRLTLMRLDGPGLDPESAEALRKLVAKGVMGAGAFRTDDCRGGTTRPSAPGASSSSRSPRNGRTASRRSSATTTATGTR
ncbi:hypothetical protein EDD90_4934 [Streptomyces sp. Ag109_O5-1]|nr:hypothetical protein EDD90_4934 [Streptomyces sp. Ag109_O5-1]